MKSVYFSSSILRCPIMPSELGVNGPAPSTKQELGAASWQGAAAGAFVIPVAVELWSQTTGWWIPLRGIE